MKHRSVERLEYAILMVAVLILVTTLFVTLVRAETVVKVRAVIVAGSGVDEAYAEKINEQVSN